MQLNDPGSLQQKASRAEHLKYVVGALLGNRKPNTSVVILSAAGLNKLSNESSCLSLGPNPSLNAAVPAGLQTFSGLEMSNLWLFTKREILNVSVCLCMRRSPANLGPALSGMEADRLINTVDTQPTAIWANWEDWEYPANPAAT